MLDQLYRETPDSYAVAVEASLLFLLGLPVCLAHDALFYMPLALMTTTCHSESSSLSSSFLSAI
jgi:hypothetical protein